MDRVCVFIVGLCLAGMVSGEGQRILAEIRENVTLPCKTEERPPAEVDWRIRAEDIKFHLDSRDKNLTEDAPERYRCRVELQDPQNGDVSLVLKKVTAEDKGTYKCYVQKASNRRKRSIELVSTVYLDVPSPSDLRISAVIGGDVTLPCSAQKYIAVEWTRPGVETVPILVFRGNNSNPKDTPEPYQGRVELKDPQKGDMSLVLKNVTTEDKGSYECYVQKASNRRKRSSDQPISNVYVDFRHPPAPHVPPPPPPSGRTNIGLIVALLAVVVTAMAAVAAFVLKKKQRSSPPPPPDKEAEKPLQIPPTAADSSIP